MDFKWIQFFNIEMKLSFVRCSLCFFFLQSKCSSVSWFMRIHLWSFTSLLNRICWNSVKALESSGEFLEAILNRIEYENNNETAVFFRVIIQVYYLNLNICPCWKTFSSCRHRCGCRSTFCILLHWINYAGRNVSQLGLPSTHSEENWFHVKFSGQFVRTGSPETQI